MRSLTTKRHEYTDKEGKPPVLKRDTRLKEHLDSSQQLKKKKNSNKSKNEQTDFTVERSRNKGPGL